MLCLVVELAGRHLVHSFRDGSLSVGTASDNDAVIASPYVSRHHVRLVSEGRSVTIEDLGSRNGTWLGGRRITRETVTAPFELRLGRSLRVLVANRDTDDVRLGLSSGIVSKAASADTPTQPDARVHRSANLLRELACALPGHEEATLARLAGATCAALVVRWRDEHPVLLGESGAGWPEPPWRSLLRRVREGETLGAASAPGEWTHATVATHDGPLTLLMDAPIEPAWLSELHWALTLVARRPIGGASRTPVSRGGFDASLVPGLVTGGSRVMRELHERLADAARSSLPVLLEGPTGAGKELHARAVHAHSSRAAGPFRAVNSSALPEPLQESLFFGVEEGVATGVRRQAGLLREADGGTLFLDEIGDMGPAMQAKMLRVLDAGEVLPLGSARPVRVDVRIIAATNRDLEADCRDGRFRADLYHRLAGHVLRVPPLSERPDDVPVLVRAFLEDECRRHGRNVTGVTVKAMQELAARPWPGNVRQLELLVRRLVHEVADGQPITHASLGDETAGAAGSAKAVDPPTWAAFQQAQDEREADFLRRALAAEGGNADALARRLGCPQTTLRRALSRHGLR